MKLLDKLVLKDLVPMLLMGIALFSMFFFVLGPLLAAARFVEQGVPLWVIAQFLGWDFTIFVSYTFPLSMLLASLLGFDRLSRESEAVALFAGGIPFVRISAPVAALGLAVSLAGYVFNDRVASYANQRVAEIKEHRQDVMSETTKAFHFENRRDGVLQLTVQVEKGYDVQAKALRDVTVTTFDSKGFPTLVAHAALARWSGGTSFHLFNGAVSDLKTGGRLESDDLKTWNLEKTPENLLFLQRDPDTLNFRQLQSQIAQLKASGGSSEEVRDAEVNLWFKIALPFSCLVFGLVGAPLGLRPQRSSKLSGWLWALPIMLVYYVLYMSMSSIARGGGCPPALAAFLPNIIGIIVGGYLIWKAST